MLPCPRLSSPLWTISIAALSLLAAGCADRRSAATAPSLETHTAALAGTAWSALEPRSALIRMPAVPPTAVIERRMGDSLAQEIALPGRPGLGPNRFVLAVHRGSSPVGATPDKPSEAGIRAELAAAFPGKAMRILPQPRRNAFGPYGLAVASGPGAARCVYAWQWLDRVDAKAGGLPEGDVSWRARLCRNDASLDAIAADLDALAFAPADAGALEPRTIAQPASRPRRAVTASREPKALPIPADLDTTAAPGGRRYLAPVNAVASAGLPRVPATASAGRTALDTSLPAEAYRGPTLRGGGGLRLMTSEAALPRVLVPTPD